MLLIGLLNLLRYPVDIAAATSLSNPSREQSSIERPLTVDLQNQATSDAVLFMDATGPSSLKTG
jgi:hypothetical protein